MTDGGPAFPQNDAAVNRINNHDGMSLRAWFAGMAMQGMLARSSYFADYVKPSGVREEEAIAHYAVLYADALLAELEKERKDG